MQNKNTNMTLTLMSVKDLDEVDVEQPPKMIEDEDEDEVEDEVEEEEEEEGVEKEEAELFKSNEAPVWKEKNSNWLVKQK